MLFKISFSRKFQFAIITAENSFIGMQAQMTSKGIFSKCPITQWAWNFAVITNIPFVEHFMEDTFSFCSATKIIKIFG